MSSGQPLAKRLKTDTTVAIADSADAPSAKESSPAALPTSFVTWNCNGLVSRCNWNVSELKQMLEKTDYPDVLCLQEVRLKATSSSNRGIPLSSDYQKNGVQQVIESTVFSNYDKFWSLADKKYAGTLTLLHKRLQFASNNNNAAAFSTQSAIALLLKQYHLTRQEVGLPEHNNNNQASPPNPKMKKATQTSMKSFFAPKASPNNKAPVITTSTTTSCQHHEEGRFQFFSFPNMDLMQTYVPNNGNKLESFQRRREWDQDIKAFLLARQQILQKASSSSSSQSNTDHRPLLWCGDCNVAKTYQDGSHWQKNSTDNTIYEWWKDESKCYASGQGGDKLVPNRHEHDKGLASFTEHERLRFHDILESADLSDVWRVLHPQGTTTADDNNNNNPRLYATIWDRPDYTWRGHLSKGGQYPSKYEGKGQRIDYFLLSPSSLLTQQQQEEQAAVESCDILGYGTTREGFCGSDHCPQLLKLKRPL